MRTPKIEKCIPPGNTILAIPIVENDYKDGIYIPDASRESTTYEIIALGTMFDESCGLKIGDKVLIAGKGGDMLNHQGKIYWTYPIENVIATIED